MANVTYNIMMGLRKRAFDRRAQQQQRQQQQQEKSKSTFSARNLDNYYIPTMYELFLYTSFSLQLQWILSIRLLSLRTVIH